MKKPLLKEQEKLTLIPCKTKAEELIADYIEGDQLEKKGKAKKEAIKAELIEWLKKNHTPDIYLSKDKDSSARDPIKVYEWLYQLEKIPKELLESLVVKTIDDKGLDILFEERLIEVEEIPEECYSTRKGAVKINIVANRKRKKD